MIFQSFAAPSSCSTLKIHQIWQKKILNLSKPISPWHFQNLKPGFRVLVLSKVDQGFSSFFGVFDDFSKWRALKVLRNFEKSSNVPQIWQKMKKSLVQLAFNPFFGWFQVPETRVSGIHSTTKYICGFSASACFLLLARIPVWKMSVTFVLLSHLIKL